MTLRLNTIAPAEGAKRESVRLGRGIGSGMGKRSEEQRLNSSHL